MIWVACAGTGDPVLYGLSVHLTESEGWCTDCGRFVKLDGRLGVGMGVGSRVGSDVGEL